MKKNAYIGISFIVLVFGILFVPKIVNRIQQQDWVSSNRLSASQNELVYINLNGENKKVPDFVLTNQDSLFISNEDYLGKVYLVEFFFTSCPTICPRMNVNMKKIEAVFGDREDFGIASITIDPENDTPSQLKTYTEAYEVFSPNWHFLTGDQDYIYELANRGFNIFAGINPDVAGGFEHQGYFALVDQQGYIRSRTDSAGNPIVYYLGIDEEDVDQQGTEMLLEDIPKLLENE
ncbi:MAG: SCO family protein [Flavobacteriaceae bacterium]